MRILSVAVVLGSLLLAAGCGNNSNENVRAGIDRVDGNSNFDPANSVVPFPNNLLFLGTADGTLNIPVADANDLSDPQVALNALDGFSTVAPFTTGFTTALDPATVNGSSVRVFQVTLSGPGGAVVGVTRELTYGLDFIASVASTDPSGETLAVVPLKTLSAKTSYYVVITSSLRAASGGAIAASAAYALTKGAAPLVDGGGVSQVPALSDAQAQALEPLRQLTHASESTIVAAASPALTQPAIILSWSFTTQSITDVLAHVRDTIRAGAVPASALVDSGADSPFGAADIYVGTLAVPYYLAASAGIHDPTALQSYWKGAGGSNLTQYNPNPVATTTQTIPLMASIPKAGCPASSCPVVIYQHGITQNRATMLALADSMAQAGFAVVAIDMPMHGLTGNETNGTQAFYDAAHERTFNLDLVTQDANDNIVAATPDGITDTSGVHFINLSNLLNSRDNLRQSVADLFTLTYALNSMTAGANGFDTSHVYFLGHSLGGITGVTFLALDATAATPVVKDAVIAMSGGGIGKLLDGSAAYGPTIANGLAAQGVIKGTSNYEAFIAAAQTVIDSGDPINFAPSAVSGRGMLFIEVVGGAGVPSDLVVPNRVPDGNDISGTVPGPLAGTDPLVSVDADVPNPGLGLTQYDTTTAADNLLALVRYTAGDHGSILSPAASAAATTEMQKEAATFLGSDLVSGGAVNQLLVTDSSVIAAP